MSCIVKCHNKKTGTTYVYESVSYWTEKGPRTHRRCIGKIDPETGEIVPTGRSGRPRKGTDEGSTPPDAKKPRKKPSAAEKRLMARLEEQDAAMKALRVENRRLQYQLKVLGSKLTAVAGDLNACIDRCSQILPTPMAPPARPAEGETDRMEGISGTTS